MAREKISVISKDPRIPRHKGAVLIEGVPLTTKIEFKAACARNNKTMRDVCIQLFREYATKHLRLGKE